jgi:hypothetical protein
MSPKKFTITNPAVLINLIGDALCEAIQSDHQCVFVAGQFDLVWNLTEHKFRAVARRPKEGWDYTEPWTEQVDDKVEIVVKWRMLAVDVREGPTSHGWWKLIGEVGYALEQRGIYKGPWPRIKD